MYWFLLSSRIIQHGIHVISNECEISLYRFGSLVAMLCRDDKAILTGNDNKYTTATFLQSYVKLKAIQNY